MLRVSAKPVSYSESSSRTAGLLRELSGVAMDRGTDSVLDFVRSEMEWLDRTKRDCYAATSSQTSCLSPNLMLRQPIVDECRIKAGSVKPSWPNGASFAVCLTHDVDHVTWGAPQGHWKRFWNHLRNGDCFRNARAARGLRSAAVELGRAVMRRRMPDSLHCYEQWLHLEEQVGARSTFLFLPDCPGKPHYTDGTYRYADRIVFDGQSCSVGEMMRELHRRGWEVGLHASWHSFDSVDEMQRQKEQIERAIDASVVSVRHHYLHFDIRCTPWVHSRAGLRVDSSLGFNDDIGFRFGTSYPWHLHDSATDGESNVLELPLVIQDKCLIRHVAQGNATSALEWASVVIDRLEAVGGVLTLLWHPCTIRHTVYVEVYAQLLAILKRRNGWFGTMAEIAHWWEKDE